MSTPSKSLFLQRLCLYERLGGIFTLWKTAVIIICDYMEWQSYENWKSYFLSTPDEKMSQNNWANVERQFPFDRVSVYQALNQC